MPSGEYCIVASNGFLRHHGYTFSAIILTLHYGTLHFSSVWTAVQFVFRKNLLCATGYPLFGYKNLALMIGKYDN